MSKDKYWKICLVFLHFLTKRLITLSVDRNILADVLIDTRAGKWPVYVYSLRFICWGDIILAVYPSLSLSDQNASCSSAHAGWQRNRSAQTSVKLQENTAWKTNIHFRILKLKRQHNTFRVHLFNKQILISCQFIGGENMSSIRLPVEIKHYFIFVKSFN